MIYLTNKKEYICSRMQKKLIPYLAIFILFQSMFTNINLFFEIDELVEDYKLHQTKYGDNLTTFISKHFGDLRDSHKEQHKEEHKHHNHPIHSELGSNIQEIYVLQNYNFTINTIEKIRSKTDNFYYKNLLSNFEKQKIFQPPRIA